MDAQYRTLMQISVADPLVLSLIVPSAKRNPLFQGQQLQQLLQEGSMDLEGIIMALESVLYAVRAHFPRLFFLSDSELVALLAAPLESCEAQLCRGCIPGSPGESGLVSRGSQGLRSPLESRRGSLGAP